MTDRTTPERTRGDDPRDRVPRLSLLFDMTSPEWATPASSLYAAAVDLAARADELGFARIVLHEHHNTDDGYLPAPIVLGAAIAARTTRLKLVLSAVVAPLRHPLHLAEELAVLDLLAQGRLSVVLVAGARESEYAMFGLPFRGRGAVLDETVETLRQAWTGEPFQFRGAPARVLPMPYQPGGPPLSLGGMTKGSARRAARLGVGYRPVMPQLHDVYRDELERLGTVAPAAGGPGAAPVSSGGRRAPTFLHISENPDADWKRIAPHALHHANTFTRWVIEAGADETHLVADADALRCHGDYASLTPDECIELFEAVGADGGIEFRPLLAGLDVSMAETSFDLLEREVLPGLGRRRAER